MFAPFFIFIFFLWALPQAQAVPVNLEEIDQRDVDTLTRELSANFTHTIVSGAASLGRVLGFEVGGMIGATYTPGIGELVRKYNPKIDTNAIPHGAYVGALTLPFGVTLEGATFPTRDLENVRFGHYSGGLKWTPTMFFIGKKASWLNVAFKAHGARSSLDVEQFISNASTQNQRTWSTLQIRNFVWGGSATVGLSLGFFEPYVGGGYLDAQEKLFVVAPGGGTIFAPGAQQGDPQHALGHASSVYGMVGLLFNAFFFHWSAEYSELFGTKRVTTKISFGI